MPTHAQTRKDIHTHAHACTHARTHTRTHKHTHTLSSIHAHPQSLAFHLSGSLKIPESTTRCFKMKGLPFAICSGLQKICIIWEEIHFRVAERECLLHLLFSIDVFTVCVWVRECVRVCIHVRVHARTRAFSRACTHTRLRAHTHAYTRIHTLTHTQFTRTQTHAQTHAQTHEFSQRHIHTHTHTIKHTRLHRRSSPRYVCVLAYADVCVCVCVCVCVRAWACVSVWVYGCVYLGGWVSGCAWARSGAAASYPHTPHWFTPLDPTHIQTHTHPQIHPLPSPHPHTHVGGTPPTHTHTHTQTNLSCTHNFFQRTTRYRESMKNTSSQLKYSPSLHIFILIGTNIYYQYQFQRVFRVRQILLGAGVD